MQQVYQDHPVLGRFTGVSRGPDVVQFRGIPFGRIASRWRQAQLATELSAAERQCTEYGDACPQLKQTLEPFGGPVEGEPERTYNELSCLNLTITTPSEVVLQRSARKVPVMVYVHGGGFAEGAHYGAVHDCTRIVELSCKHNEPVVIVSIHYRLNFFGLMACQDLIDDAKEQNEPPCNFALYDQRLAFQWVQRYIDGFGGDPAKITAFGESAGSASLSYHVCSTVPIFKRVILESGSPSTIPATPLESKEEVYLAVLKYCDIAEDDPERLAKLRCVPAQKLLDAKLALKIFAHSPLAHESFFPVAPNYFNQCDILAKSDWVEAMIIGDCVYEGYLFSEILKHIKPEKFTKLVEETIGHELASKLLGSYQIDAKMHPNLFWTRLNMYVGDVMFSMPVHQITRSLASQNKKVHRYTLSLRNPFPGSVFSNVLGHHFIDLLYQFMTLLERYPQERQKEVSIQFAKYWIDFANGNDPWPNVTLGESESGSEKGIEVIAVADSREGWVIRSRKQDEELSQLAEDGPRRYQQWDTLINVFDELGEHAQNAMDSISFPALTAIAEE